MANIKNKDKIFLIKNNGTKQFIFNIKINNEEKRQTLQLGITAMPGDIFRTIEETDDFKRLLEKKYIEIIFSKVQKAETPEEKETAKKEKEENIQEGACHDLQEFNKEDAIKLIKETLSLKVLKDWSGKENRVTVSKAIDAQINKLTTDDTEDKE